MLNGCFEGHPTQYLYYLKGSAVIGQVVTSTNLDNDCTQL